MTTIDERTNPATDDDFVTDRLTSAATPIVSVEQQTVTVSLLGSNDVKVTVEGAGDTVEDVLRKAAALLDVRLNTTQVGVVRNGSPATLDEPVKAQDRVTAAPRTSNG